LFQLSENGEADYDTIIGMLPEALSDRGGKMLTKCRHISEYPYYSILVWSAKRRFPWNESNNTTDPVGTAGTKSSSASQNISRTA
jgi:hypothetical protein